MNIEIIECAVYRDGQGVGKYQDGVFTPNEGLHHKTVEKIKREIASLAGESKEPQPAWPAPSANDPEPARGELGDIATDLIEWRKRNWPADQFAEVYPAYRLKLLGLTHLAD